jgi:hypothetical protein
MLQIGYWGLPIACFGLIFFGQFVFGLVAVLSWAALNICGREWARKVEARYRDSPSSG